LNPNELARFEEIKREINHLLRMSGAPQALLLQITDSINIVCCMTSSTPILEEIFKLLRIQLLSDRRDVEKTVILLDMLVKNSDYKVHTMIGDRRMMKTLSKVGRRMKSSGHDTTADLVFDTLQAWGEAFLSRRYVLGHGYACINTGINVCNMTHLSGFVATFTLIFTERTSGYDPNIASDSRDRNSTQHGFQSSSGNRQ
jgi:hypothetical protein